MVTCRKLGGATFVVQIGKKPIYASVEFKTFSANAWQQNPLHCQSNLSLTDFLPGHHILMPSFQNLIKTPEHVSLTIHHLI